MNSGPSSVLLVYYISTLNTNQEKKHLLCIWSLTEAWYRKDRGFFLSKTLILAQEFT